MSFLFHIPTIIFFEIMELKHIWILRVKDIHVHGLEMEELCIKMLLQYHKGIKITRKKRKLHH